MQNLYSLKGVLNLFLTITGIKGVIARRAAAKEGIDQLIVATERGMVLLTFGDKTCCVDPKTAKQYAQTIIKASNQLTR